MRLFLTEKPSQAKILKEVIGTDDEIIALEGHILELVGLDYYYDNKKWYEIYDELKGGIKIVDFKKLPKKEPLLSGRTADEILKSLKELSQKAQEIILATDPDDEGVVLGLEALEFVGAKDKLKGMLLMNALEKEALKKALTNIKSVKDFVEPMQKSGLLRSYSDYLLGMNGSIIATISLASFLDSQTLHLGGVKTPVLRMIVERDKLYEENKQTPFWTLNAKHQALSLAFEANKEKKFYQKPLELFESFCQINEFNITSNKTKTSSTPAPLPYSLSDLQVELATQHKFDPSLTLEICQKLYMQGFISYPRTDLNYYSDEFLSSCDEILENLKNKFSFTKQVDKPRSFDSSKLDGEAHTSLAPTANIPTELNEQETIVYEKIATRFIIQFLNPHSFKEQTIQLEKNEFTSKIVLKNTLALGYLDFLQKKGFADVLLELSDTLAVESHELKEQTEKPAPRFTKATLLKAMEDINKHLQDAKLTKGIGTQATRANAIADLQKKGYFEMQKDSIISSQKARLLIELLPQDLTSPALRSKLEQTMQDIKKNQETKSLEQILNEYKSFLDSQFAKLIAKQQPIVKQTKTLELLCPLCKEKLIEQEKAFKCSANKYDPATKSSSGCKFVVFKDIKPAKHKLSIKDLQTLLETNKLELKTATLTLDLKNKFFTSLSFKSKK